MDQPVGFIDAACPRWPSAFSDPRLEADLGSTQHGYSVYEFQVNGS
jgi:hypothetical protein